MLLRQLYEAPVRLATLAFGRLNPPTIGHAKLVDAVRSQDGDHYLFLSHTQKPKTDPLDFATKVKLAKRFFPGISVGDADVKTPIQALQKLQGLGYTDIVFIAGSDRVDSFQKLFDTYNGQPDKTGKVPFKFNSIRVVSAGERDPDADGAEGMSASKMRAAASSSDFESFAQGVPDKRLARDMYNVVRKGMGVTKTTTEAFDTDVEWVDGPGANGSTVFAAKVDDAYIEITYMPMSDGVYISFTRGGVMSVTGEGGQNKIFGAVINHIKKWTDKNQPNKIYFSAFKPNTGPFGSKDTTRSGLYRKMVQRFANQNGYKFDVEDTGNEDTFTLTKQTTNTQTNEALDQPYPVRWSVKNDDQWFGHAKEDDFYNQMGIEIKSISEGRWSIRFKVGDKMDKTGKGDQFKIFATVKSAVQEWWKWASKNAQVDQITFSAEKILDGSRSKLYNRFAQQFARAIGYNFEVVTGRASDIFYLKKPGLEENFADGKKPGRKGLAKRSGVNTKASVSDLRKTAKNSSGEKQRMAHWLANMKAGKAKKK